MHPKIIFLVLILFFSPITTQNSVCVDHLHYQNTGEQHEPILCPEGQICDDSSGLAICRRLDPVVFTLNPLEVNEPTPVPECSGAGKHATNVCNKYYECVQSWIFWWVPELRTCAEGQSFDTLTSSCLSADKVNCGTTTATTGPPPVDIPQCKGPSKHPALFCNEYFECVQVLWWYEPRLKKCPNGQAYNASSGECVCAGALGCELKQSEPKCDGPGNLPSTSCKRYYRCNQFLWWWETVLSDCPSGHSYDLSTCRCSDDPSVICTIPVPECYGWARYPAAETNQYYQCKLDSSGLEWIAVLETCYVGYIFNVGQGACVQS